jgi:hypothetical protein
MKRLAIGLLPLLLAGTQACKSEPPPPPPPSIAPTTTTLPAPVSVVTVTLGNAVGDDKKVVAPSEVFGVKDNIYASVETAGKGHAKVRALWSFVKGDKTTRVDETTIEYETTGPAVNEFHISKPTAWPKGDYRVEIFLGDDPAPTMTKTFKVA